MAKTPPPNPYDFVPFEPNPPQRHCPPQTQGTFDPNLYTGELVCLLETETPLFIHLKQERGNRIPRRFYQRGGRIVIPATSLKGMVRSVAEVVSNSCLRIASLKESDRQPGYEMSNSYKQGHFKTYKRWKISWPQFEAMHAPIPLVPEEDGPPYPTGSGVVPKGFWMCQTKNNLCPCCALFGMTERVEDEEAKAAPLAGRVRFTEARQAGNNKEVKISIPHRIGPPHPYHRPFYFDDNNKLLGRKFYYHHADYTNAIKQYEDVKHKDWITVQAQEGKFVFTVRFHNLREEELAVLVYSLMLEDDLRHHLGYGKPFGLGTVKISITEMRLMHFDDKKPSRYLDYDDQPSPSIWDTANATKWQDKGMRLWTERPGAGAAYNKFKEILKYPQTQNFRYPTFQWFRDPTKKNITLAQYQSNPSVRK